MRLRISLTLSIVNNPQDRDEEFDLSSEELNEWVQLPPELDERHEALKVFNNYGVCNNDTILH